MATTPTLNETQQWLYDQFKDNGYNMPAPDQFLNDLSDESKRKWLFEKGTNELKLSLGSYDDFTGDVRYEAPKPVLTDAQKAEADAVATSVAQNAISAANTPKPEAETPAFGVPEQPQVQVPMRPQEQTVQQTVDNQPNVDGYSQTGNETQPAEQTTNQFDGIDIGVLRQMEKELLDAGSKNLSSRQKERDDWRAKHPILSNLSPEMAMGAQGEKQILAERPELGLSEKELANLKAIQTEIGKRTAAGYKEVMPMLSDDVDASVARKNYLRTHNVFDNPTEYSLASLYDSNFNAIKKIDKSAAEGNSDLNSKSARYLRVKANEMLSAPTRYDDKSGFSSAWQGMKNFGEGMGENLFDRKFFATVDAQRNLRIGNLAEKLNKGESLSKTEEELLDAFFALQWARAQRQNDLSLGYEIGEGAADSAPFMVDMILSHGASQMAKKAVVRSIERSAGKEVAEKVAKWIAGREGISYAESFGKDLKNAVPFTTKSAEITRGALKESEKAGAGYYGRYAAREAVETPLQTAAMATTWSNVFNDRASALANKEEWGGKEIFRSLGNMYVETLTERSGGAVIDKVADALPFFKIFNGVKYMQDPVTETGEEYLGGGINAIRGIVAEQMGWYDTKSNMAMVGEFKEMCTPEGFFKTFGTVLPMTLMGPAMNGAAKAYDMTSTWYSMYQYESSRKGVMSLLAKYGANKEQVDKIMSSIDASENVSDFADKMRMFEENITQVKDGELDLKEYKALVDFAQSFLAMNTEAMRLNQYLAQFDREGQMEVVGNLRNAMTEMQIMSQAKYIEKQANDVDGQIYNISYAGDTKNEWRIIHGDVEVSDGKLRIKDGGDSGIVISSIGEDGVQVKVVSAHEIELLADPLDANQVKEGLAKQAAADEILDEEEQTAEPAPAQEPAPASPTAGQVVTFVKEDTNEQMNLIDNGDGTYTPADENGQPTPNAQPMTQKDVEALASMGYVQQEPVENKEESETTLTDDIETAAGLIRNENGTYTPVDSNGNIIFDPFNINPSDKEASHATVISKLTFYGVTPEEAEIVWNRTFTDDMFEQPKQEPILPAGVNDKGMYEGVNIAYMPKEEQMSAIYDEFERQASEDGAYSITKAQRKLGIGYETIRNAWNNYWATKQGNLGEYAEDVFATNENHAADVESAPAAPAAPENNVPDWIEDSAKEARERGFRMVNGARIDRQDAHNLHLPIGKQVDVAFASDPRYNMSGNYTLIDAAQLQPSHLNGSRNPMFFITEAQPKERTDQASQLAALDIADNINPNQIVNDAGTAYAGSPVINSRGEVIQGNNRSIALKEMYSGGHEESVDKYKQFLIDNADRFGLSAEAIQQMEAPVLVRRIDVSDADAIVLGQMAASDTESGGVERIKPQQTLNKLGDNVANFANILLSSDDENATLSDVVTKNGDKAIEYLTIKGCVTPTQRQSCYDKNGNLTPEAKKDLLDVVKGILFVGSKYDNIESFFDSLPSLAQKAILQTVHRSLGNKQAEDVRVATQDAIATYYFINTENPQFAEIASRSEDALKIAINQAHAWYGQTNMNMETGETIVNSNRVPGGVSLDMAAWFKARTQKTLVSAFNIVYDQILGSKQQNLFEENTNGGVPANEALQNTFNNGKQNNTSNAGGTEPANGKREQRPADSVGNNQGAEQVAPGAGTSANVGGSVAVPQTTESNAGGNRTAEAGVTPKKAKRQKKIIALDDEAKALADDIKNLLDQRNDINGSAGIDANAQARIDAEILAKGTRLGVTLIKKGAVQFIDFCDNMIESLSDAIRPYLQEIYLACKSPRLGLDRNVVKQMDAEDAVLDFDVNNYDNEDDGETEANKKGFKKRDESKAGFNPDTESFDNVPDGVEIHNVKKQKATIGNNYDANIAVDGNDAAIEFYGSSSSESYSENYVVRVDEDKRNNAIELGYFPDESELTLTFDDMQEAVDAYRKIYAPTEEQVKSDQTIGTITEQDGKYVIVPTTRVEKEEFKKLANLARSNHGGYKNGVGYVFNTKEDAERFNRGEQPFEQPKEDKSLDDALGEAIKAGMELRKKQETLDEVIARQSFVADVTKALYDAAMNETEKPYKSIVDIRNAARAAGMVVDTENRDDIKLQELVEDGIVRAARHVVEKLRREGSDAKTIYDAVVRLYNVQPTISRRSGERIDKQQYSTPLPMSFVADMFAYREGMELGLEPTAGNGMLVFGIPAHAIDVNEIDETRKTNLLAGGFAHVTDQDATVPFNRGRVYDFVVSNPPFGSLDAKQYGDYRVSGLAQQIAINALEQMKDDGRAAIIVGGNMQYSDNGALSADKTFYGYLYDNYNVVGVVDMAGDLYAKQGTSYPTRMILIDGRRSEEERAKERIYPPVQSKALPKANSFDELYNIIDELNQSNTKTNGHAVLRSERGTTSDGTNSSNTPGNANGTGRAEQPNLGNGTGRGTGTDKRNNAGVQAENGVQVSARGESTGTPRQTSLFDTDGGFGVDSGRESNVGDRTRTGEQLGSGRGIVRETKREERKLDQEKLSYVSHNTGDSLNSVSPAAIAEAMDKNMKKIESEVGDIEEFLLQELGYRSIDELHKALKSEQIDSVAMAIYQMKKGQGLIIGDQTGVGKGRQVASLIRWARRQGKKPVFITKDKGLFTDIYRDLVGIGSSDLIPFIINSDGVMEDKDGNVIYKSLSAPKQKEILKTGKVPDGYDFAVLTYSQLGTGDEISRNSNDEKDKKSQKRKSKESKPKKERSDIKAQFVRAISKDNYLLLDESHMAAGDGKSGSFMRSILPSALGVTFSSATFAKRPDTMPLYALKTAMSKANVETQKLIEIIEKGGVTLQEIMSRALAESGQMVRRERDMSDVITDWEIVDDKETVEKARKEYDSAIRAFGEIIKFQTDFVNPYLENMRGELAEVMETAVKKKGTDKMGINNQPFANRTYNYTKQLIFSLKTKAIVERVVREIKEGKHPLIAIENTMESGLKEYSIGSTVENPTFAASLLKGLQNTLAYTKKNDDGTETHHYISPSELGPEGEIAYYKVRDFIIESTKDIYISPIDDIVEQLQKLGYKTGELTGRKLFALRNDGGSVVVKSRGTVDTKELEREFNRGAIDVLILNKKGSTGISLHASEDFSDQRQRVMIVAQPLSDINDYMQMIGRIDRTGQVVRGYYINLGLPVPAENRLLMMLSTKLKSLNANTTTSQDNEDNDVKAPDLLNKYGSRAVLELLVDNPALFNRLSELDMQIKDGEKTVENIDDIVELKPSDDAIIRKITGYVALLTTEEQDAFYNELVERYNELIKGLNETGQNDLKITTMPLRAKTIEKKVSSEGVEPDGDNPFAQNAYLETVEMDVLRKPMKAAEVEKLMETVKYGKEEGRQRLLDVITNDAKEKQQAERVRYDEAYDKAEQEKENARKSINARVKMSEEEKKAAIEARINEIEERVERTHAGIREKIEYDRRTLSTTIRQLNPGDSYLVPDDLTIENFGSSSPAIFIGFKAKDSKVTPSTTFAVFAVLDGRKKIEVKLSDKMAINMIINHTNQNYDAAHQVDLSNWDEQIPNENRKQGYILTGNILQAFADSENDKGGLSGQLISYTDIDGNIHDGILMPDSWTPMMMRNNGVPINARLSDLKKGEDLVSIDKSVKIAAIPNENGSGYRYKLYVPKTKASGAKYFADDIIKQCTKNGFDAQVGEQLTADVYPALIDQVVLRLANLGVRVDGKVSELNVPTYIQDDGDPKNLFEFSDRIFGIKKKLEHTADKNEITTLLNELSSVISDEISSLGLDNAYAVNTVYDIADKLMDLGYSKEECDELDERIKKSDKYTNGELEKHCKGLVYDGIVFVVSKNAVSSKEVASTLIHESQHVVNKVDSIVNDLISVSTREECLKIVKTFAPNTTLYDKKSFEDLADEVVAFCISKYYHAGDFDSFKRFLQNCKIENEDIINLINDYYEQRRTSITRERRRSIGDVVNSVQRAIVRDGKNLQGESVGMENSNVSGTLGESGGEFAVEKQREIAQRKWNDKCKPFRDALYDLKTRNSTAEMLIKHFERRGINIEMHSQEEADNTSGIELKDKNGVVYGWYENGTIHLVEGRLNPNTTLHEASHMISAIMREHNPEGWADIVRVCKEAKDAWNEVVNDPNYSGLKTDDEIASEVIARYSGKRGAEKMVDSEKKAKEEGVESYARARVVFNNVRDALKKFWGWVNDNLFARKKFDNLDDVADAYLYELLGDGQLPTPPKGGKREAMITPPSRLPGESIYEHAARVMEYFNSMRVQDDVNDYLVEIQRQGQNKATFQREWLDAAAPIMNFLKYMEEKGAKLDETMNPYEDTFLASGRSSTAQKHYEREYVLPLEDKIREIIKSGDLRGVILKWQNIGIEEQAFQKMVEEKLVKEDKRKNGERLTPYEIMGVYAQAKDCLEANELGLPDRGLKGFVENLGVTAREVVNMVESALGAEKCKEFWEKVNAATSFALDYQLKHGYINEKTRNKYRRDYYVPERGWRPRDLSEIESHYINGRRSYGQQYNKALQRAYGRSTLASDPFQYIQSIVDSSILITEKNRTLQKFLEFCLENEELGLKTGAFRIAKIWMMQDIDPATGVAKKDPATGENALIPSRAMPTSEQFDSDKKTNAEIDKCRASIGDLKKKIDEWQALASDVLVHPMVRDMAEKQIPVAEAKIADLENKIADLQNRLHVVNVSTIPEESLRIKDEQQQHHIVVMKDGQAYDIAVKDEILANSLTKKYNENMERNWKADRLIRASTRFMSASLTQYNPEFAVTNFVKDKGVAYETLLAEQGAEFAAQFSLNLRKVQPTVWKYAANDRMLERDKFAKGKIGDYLKEYYEHGAQTGFSYLKELNKIQSDFEKAVEQKDAMRVSKNVTSFAIGSLAMLTEVSETAIRFAAYVTARERGMSADKAAYLSKELTTNFDRGGEKASSSALAYFSFMRAAINGNLKFFRMFKKSAKMLSGFAVAHFILGALCTLMNPDDPDNKWLIDEWGLGEHPIYHSRYTRMSNYVIGRGKLPVLHFMRMFHAMGVNLALALQGRNTWRRSMYDTISFISSELLTNYLNGASGYDFDVASDKARWEFDSYVQSSAPSAVSPVVDVWLNQDFTGRTIDGHRVDYNPYLKDIKKKRADTPKIYTDWAEGTYKLAGGNVNVDNNYRDNGFVNMLDISPTTYQHIVEGYSPGFANTIMATASAIHSAINGEFNASDIPFLRKFYSSYNEGSVAANEYWELKMKCNGYTGWLNNANKKDRDAYNKEKDTELYKVYDDANRFIKSMDVNNPSNSDIKELMKYNKLWNEAQNKE